MGSTALGPALIRLVTTPEYVPGAAVIPLVGLGYLLLMISGMNETVLNLRLASRPLMVVYAAAAVLNLVLTFILVRAAGFVGAGLATLATFAALVVMTSILARRAPTFRVNVAALIKQSLAAIMMGGVLWTLSPSDVIGLVLAIPLGAACYGALLFLLRGFNVADLRAIRGVFVA